MILPREIKIISKITSVLLVVSLLIPSIVTADSDAVMLLNKMNKALHQLDYKGTLAYLHGHELSTLQINHTLINGVENEHVVRLDDSEATVSREVKGFSLSSIPQISAEMQKVYSFDIGRSNVVATVPCVIVTARPKDRERYLQKYCIDTKTGMLLDYKLVGKSHKAVEHFMFTKIDITMPSNAEDMPDNSKMTESVVSKTSNSQKVKLLSRDSVSADLDDGWVMEALPAGYDIKLLKQPLTASTADAKTKHYVVSDGLSSLSVFVSPLTGNDLEGAVKINSGGLNVVSQRKGKHVVTVVGQVPEGTLKKIINNIRQNKK